jgi:hypothetical protein
LLDVLQVVVQIGKLLLHVLKLLAEVRNESINHGIQGSGGAVVAHGCGLEFGYGRLGVLETQGRAM